MGWFTRNVLPLIAAAAVLCAVTAPAEAQYCVRYARSITGLEVRGNAWAWWDNAAGVYPRGQEPMIGSVLVFRRGGGGMGLGHVSAVTGIVDDRTILVTHSFGGPYLWRDVPIEDVSDANDWTRVRVWHGPTRQMSSTRFPTYGFVYPHEPEPTETAEHAGADARHAGSTVSGAGLATRLSSAQ
jgi:surface antigen